MTDSVDRIIYNYIFINGLSVLGSFYPRCYLIIRESRASDLSPKNSSGYFVNKYASVLIYSESLEVKMYNKCNIIFIVCHLDLHFKQHMQ